MITRKARFFHATEALQYAKAVVAGEILACKWVTLACQRHIGDLSRQKDKEFPYRFDKKRAEKVCRFIEKLRHIKGQWAGTEIRLEPWQSFITCAIFGWINKRTQRRRFREAYIEVPRKNAKSTWAAAVGLYLLAADGEPGAEVYSGATTEKQAWEVFRPARLMANKDLDLQGHYGITVNASNLCILETAAKFEPVIGNPGDGPSPHCAIVDEFHEHRTSEQYDSHITGMGSRTQPLLLIITTAGSNLCGPCYDKRAQVCKILEGIEGFENNEVFGIIYSIDDTDDWADFSVWKKANPNFGVSVFEDYLRARHKEALQRASRQNIIRCKHLNQWTNAAVAWMDMVAWRKCADPNLKPEQFAGKPVWVALDLASKIDVAELVRLYKWEDEQGKEHYAVFCNHYLPEEAIEGEDKTHYAGWAKEGWITLTPGNVIDFEYIKDDLRDYKTQFEIQEAAYDPFQATQLSTEMLGEGFPMIEFGATVKNFSHPMKEWEALVLSGCFHHNGDPVLTWMVSNIIAYRDKKDNIFPQKERPEAKIDGPVGIIMALARAMQGIDDKPKDFRFDVLTIG